MFIKLDDYTFVSTSKIIQFRINDRDPNTKMVTSLKVVVADNNNTEYTVKGRHAQNLWTCLLTDPSFTDMEAMRALEVI